jgi:catechol 2,3-dioxygenase-like lactoylglutathione lyase family enzyme
MVSKPQNEVHLQDVAQIAFTVQNLAEAKIFYRDVLELKFLFEATLQRVAAPAPSPASPP